MDLRWHVKERDFDEVVKDFLQGLKSQFPVGTVDLSVFSLAPDIFVLNEIMRTSSNCCRKGKYISEDLSQVYHLPSSH